MIGPNANLREQPDSTLHLPRLLCLHGGGTNAKIFNAQTRALQRYLSPYFRFCFADAPFICQSHGPDVTRVYKDYGPYRRWMRWLPDHPEIETQAAIKAIETSLVAAVQEDDAKGATGEWVGVLGFSQGAKVAGSLLLRQQMRAERGLGLDGKQRAGLRNVKLRFGVLMAGRGPLIALESKRNRSPELSDAGELTVLEQSLRKNRVGSDCLLRVPTVHVHGLRDPGLEMHRLLLDGYCEEESARLVEWDGEHRIPLKSADVSAIVDQILDVARETGALMD